MNQMHAKTEEKEPETSFRRWLRETSEKSEGKTGPDIVINTATLENESITEVYMDSSPDPDDILKIGPIQRLNSFISEKGWPPQNAVLTHKILYFLSLDGAVLDCIPLIEISRVRALAVEPGWRSLGVADDPSNESTKTTKAEKKKKANKSYPFAIHTIEQGFNGGRSYYVRVDSKADRVSWVLNIAQKAGADADARHGTQSSFAKVSAMAREFHRAPACQYFWGILILLSFIINCLQTQPGWIDDPQNISDTTFTVLFTIELCINALGNWFW